MSQLAVFLAGAGCVLLVGFIFAGYRYAPLRRAAAASQQATARAWEDLTHIINVLPRAAALIGPHDEVLAVNPDGEAIGLTRGTRVGFPALLDQVRAVRGGEQFRGTVARVTPLGTGAPLPVVILPLDSNAVLVIADEDLASQRVEAVRRDFVANVSHELKTPIGAIGILAETIEAAAKDPAQVTHFASRLQRETARLSSLVTKIIDLSRLQSLDPRQARTQVVIAEVIDEALQRTQETARAGGIAMVPATIVQAQVLGDHSQLVDAVVNLLTNAITYSDPGSRVAVSTQLTSDKGQEQVEIKVSDNGIGIAEADQDRIFERFYRVDYGRARDAGGSGLGLAIVRHIALAHGGTVTVWSQPRQGSTFTLKLPIVKD